ncbi:MAG: type I-E CRISPR-associated protein Cse1/CasA, partial [Syntrophobacterales bacterium]|nr:type I-E CRISPR-associated protein Cse1/CasA [Syntrophobacterales bacterium]
MQPRFNLIDEPWIPCILPNNRIIHLGLLDTLVRAREIREIFHPSPLVVTALHRLLLAILHRNFGPETLEDWQKLWQRGSWEENQLKDYFARWHDRFYLFHPEWPFYQVAEMPGAITHPVQILALEAAAGNNTTLFDHNYSGRPNGFSASQAACYLLARQCYSIGFGKSHPFHFKDSPLIRGYTVFI